MKNTSTPGSESNTGDNMQPEYNLDYRKARRNRFAGQIDKSRVVVVLDPDIGEVFTTPKSVKEILRALIQHTLEGRWAE
jgi:hypothetical protein